jgi:F-type H+-transporting ATPase subunit b
VSAPEGGVAPATDAVPADGAPAHADPAAQPHAADAGQSHAADAAHSHGEGAAHSHGEGAAHDEHASGGFMQYLPKIVNFALFVSIIVFFAGKPIAAFFSGRRKSIEDSFATAEAAQREAATKVAEMEQRLAALDGQVKEILARAQEQAEHERQAILESAKADAQKILAQAEAQVAELETGSVRRLKSLAADLAVEAAREIIEKQLGAEDRNRIFDRTLKALSKSATQ